MTSLGTAATTATLGTTDLEITRVGRGAWAIGGGGWQGGWGPQDDQESQPLSGVFTVTITNRCKNG